MKVAWYDRYGGVDVLDVRDVAMPEIGADDVLVKVQSSSATTADWRLRASAFPEGFWLVARLMFGLTAPRTHVLGGDFAGSVVAVGKSVTRFQAGDEVFGFSTLGAHAEYLAICADGAIAKKPTNLSFDQAAAAPFGALSALVFLRDFARVKPGQKVLVVGASGGVGVYATQLARVLGAEVTGLCSAGNMELVRSLGAEHVIDYHREDFTGADARYDVILDTVGGTSYRVSKRALTKNGVFVPLEFGLREVWQSLVTSLGRGKRVVVGVSGDKQSDMEFLSDLLARNEIIPVIDRCFGLDQIGAAHLLVESRHKTGAVVISVVSPSK